VLEDLVPLSSRREKSGTPFPGKTNPTHTQRNNMPDITHAQADSILAAARDAALETGTAMNIAVVDAGGNLKAFTRMDGAWLGSIDISIKKARTARYFDMATGSIGELSQPGGPLYNIEVSNGGLITFPGGIPLKSAAGDVIGAIGVSGSTVENDHTVAAAGASVQL
jgi:uncharacterized protein GlcG (DUF336 family)